MVVNSRWKAFLRNSCVCVYGYMYVGKSQRNLLCIFKTMSLVKFSHLVITDKTYERIIAHVGLKTTQGNWRKKFCIGWKQITCWQVCRNCVVKLKEQSGLIEQNEKKNILESELNCIESKQSTPQNQKWAHDRRFGLPWWVSLY